MTINRIGQLLDDENFFVREVVLTDALEAEIVAGTKTLTKGLVLTGDGNGKFQIGSGSDANRCVVYYETTEYGAVAKKRTAIWRGFVGLSGSALKVGKCVKVANDGLVADVACNDANAFGSVVEIVDGVAGVLI